MLDKFNSLQFHHKALIVCATPLLLVLILSVASCSPSQTAPVGTQLGAQAAQPQVYQQSAPLQPAYPQAPVVIQQAPAQSSHDGLLTGMLMGHLMSSAMQPHYSAPAPVVQHTTINKTVVQRTAPPVNNWRPPQNTYRYPAPQPTRSYSAPSRSFSRGR